MKTLIWLLLQLVLSYSAHAWDIYVDKKENRLDAFLGKKKYSVKLAVHADTIRSDSDTIYTLNQQKRTISFVKKQDFKEKITSIPYQSYSLDGVMKPDERPKSIAVYEEGDAVILYILADTAKGDEFIYPMAFTKLREGRFPLNPDSDLVKKFENETEPVRTQNFIAGKPFSVIGGEDVYAMKDPKTRGVTLLILDNEAAAIHKYSDPNAYKPTYRASFPMPKALISQKSGDLIEERDFIFSQLTNSPYTFQILSESNHPTRVANISLIEMEKDLAILRTQILTQQINEIYGNTWVKKVLGWGAISSLIDYFDGIYGNPDIDLESELIENEELVKILTEQSPEEVMEWMVESQIFTAEEIDKMRVHYRVENFRGKKWSTIAAIIGSVVVVRHLHVLKNPATRKGFALASSVIGKAYKFVMETLVSSGAISPERADKVTQYFKRIIPNFHRRMQAGRYATEYDPVYLRRKVTQEADTLLKNMSETRGVPYRSRELRLEEMLDSLKGHSFAQEGFHFPPWIHRHLPKAELLEELVARGVVKIPSIQGVTRQRALETMRRTLEKHAGKLEVLEEYARLRKLGDQAGVRLMTPEAWVAKRAQTVGVQEELAHKIAKMKKAGESAEEIEKLRRRYQKFLSESPFPSITEYLEEFPANHSRVNLDPEQFFREGMTKNVHIASLPERREAAMRFALEKMTLNLDNLGALVTKSQKAAFLGLMKDAYDDWLKAVTAFDNIPKVQQGSAWSLLPPKLPSKLSSESWKVTPAFDDIAKVNEEIISILRQVDEGDNFKKIEELYKKLGRIAKNTDPDRAAYQKVVDEIADIYNHANVQGLQDALNKLAAVVDPKSPQAIQLRTAEPTLFRKLKEQGELLKDNHRSVFDQLVAARSKLNKAGRELRKTEDWVDGKQVASAKVIAGKLADSFMTQSSWGAGGGGHNPIFEGWAKFTEYWAGLWFLRPLADKSPQWLKNHSYKYVFPNVMPMGDEYWEAVVKGSHVTKSLVSWLGEMVFDTWGACSGRNQAIDESEHCMGESENHVLKLPSWFPKFGGYGMHYEMVARTVNNTLAWWIAMPVSYAKMDVTSHRKIVSSPKATAAHDAIEIFKSEASGVGIIPRMLNGIVKGWHPVNLFKNQMLYDYPWRVMAKQMAINEYIKMHEEDLKTPEGQKRFDAYVKALNSRSSSVWSIFERKIFATAITLPYVKPQYEIKELVNAFLNKLAGNTWPGKAVDFFILPFTSAFKGSEYYGDYFGFNHPKMVAYMKEMGQAGLLEKIDPEGFSDLSTWTEDELMWFLNFVTLMEIERYRQEVPMPDVEDTEAFAAWFNQVYENLFGPAEDEIKEYVEKVQKGEEVSLGKVRLFKLPKDGREIDPPRYLEQAKQYIELFKRSENSFKTLEESEHGEHTVEVKEATEVDKTVMYTELLGKLTKTNAAITQTIADLNDNTQSGNRLTTAARNLGFLDATYMIMSVFGSRTLTEAKFLATRMNHAYVGGLERLKGRKPASFVDPDTGTFHPRKYGVGSKASHSAHKTKNLFARLAYYGSLLRPGKESSLLKSALRIMKAANLPPSVRRAALKNTHLMVKAGRKGRQLAGSAGKVMLNPWSIGLASIPAYFWFKNQMTAHSKIHVEISKLLIEIQKLIQGVSETLISKIAEAKLESLKASGELQGALTRYKEDVLSRKKIIKEYLVRAHDQAYRLCTARVIRYARVISANGVVVFGMVGGAWLLYKGVSLASTKVFKVNPFGHAKMLPRIKVSSHWRHYASFTLSSALAGWLAMNQWNEGINNRIAMRATELLTLYNSYYMTLVEAEILASVEKLIQNGKEIKQDIFVKARQKAQQDEDFVKMSGFVDSLRKLESGARCSQ